MISFLKHLAALLLCFCLICSLCGITFASGVDPDKIQMLEDWALSLEASASPDLEPSGDLFESEPEASEALPDPEFSGDPFESEPEASEALPDFEPEPTDFSFTDVRPSDVDDPGFADVPGGDVPALDPDDIASDPPSAGGDGTYIVLPDDFIIQSAGYDDTMSIDPFSLAPITPGNTSGLKAVLLSILGNYDPIVAQYQYNSGSNYGYIREIQPDYVWLVSAGVFAILLYCTWRLLGGLICKM